MTLEEKIKELEGLQGKLELAVSEKDKEIARLTVKIVKQEEDQKQLEKDVMAKDKELTIIKTQQKDAEEKAEAEKIIAEVLGKSSVKESLHGKIRKMVNINDHRTEAGAFDKASFRTAFEAEVSDWESQLKSEGARIGNGEEKEVSDDTDTNDQIAYGRNLARRATGKIRSDEK